MAMIFTNTSMRRLTSQPHGQLRNSWLSAWQC